MGFRWCRVLLAQVRSAAGAGVEKGCGPAPAERVYGGFAAQIPGKKLHLRQGLGTLAPKTWHTCTRNDRMGCKCGWENVSL